MTVMAAEGAVLDRILDARARTTPGQLSRQAHGKFQAALRKTPWGGHSQRSVALVEGGALLASAERYDLAGVVDGRLIPVCGIGSVVSEPSRSGRGLARTFIQTLLEDAARQGAEMALLFSQRGVDDDAGDDFHEISLTDLTLVVTESSRHGAPMTLVRGGEERDLEAVVTMGRTRAERFRFHLDRGIDFVRYVVARKRLLGGLAPPDARQLHFFIAEEGVTAAAYVVISAVGDIWTLEECGDRDASGARVGALLQALIAREPSERRPTLRAWLPPRFLPPQVTIASAMPSTEMVRVRMLGSAATMPRLAGDDVLYWRSDIL